MKHVFSVLGGLAIAAAVFVSPVFVRGRVESLGASFENYE